MHTRYFALIALVLLAAGFVWASFHTGAPYQAFATGVVAAAGLYGYKRHREKINNHNSTHIAGGPVPLPKTVHVAGAAEGRHYQGGEG